MTVAEYMNWLVLGQDLPAVGIRYVFLIVAIIINLRAIIRHRIGPLDAVRVVSYPRLLLSLAVCPLPYLAVHLFILWCIPSASSWALAKYMGMLFLGALVPWVPIALFGYWIDGGRALEVITSRYKPTQSAGLMDLTAERGRRAQLIPRSVIAAYVMLVILTLITIAIQ